MHLPFLLLSQESDSGFQYFALSGESNSMPAMLEATAVDALIIDPIQFYAVLAPMNLGVPYIHLAVAIHCDSGYTPLSIYGDSHQKTLEAIARNRKRVAKFAKIIGNNGVKAYARSAAFKIDWEDPGFTLSKIAWLTQTPRGFDFANSHWPSQFHHTGPAQLFLSIGDQLESEQIGPVPRNAIIVKRVPQLELLKLASVCITHSGLNRAGVPCAGCPSSGHPVTFDQPGIAARIAHHRTGVVTSLDKVKRWPSRNPAGMY
jgi:zeaxanthin glucosyltransferase